jgi:hypothetical protein
VSGFNNAAMTVAATALQAVLGYAQLHSAAAGPSYTANVTSAARQPVTWTSPTGLGNFGLAATANFTGGAANSPIYSATLWSASTGGTCYGEFVMSGLSSFNASGNYPLSKLDLTGTSS